MASKSSNPGSSLRPLSRSPRSFVLSVERGLREAHCVFDQPLVAAVSGGPDSTALLLALIEIRERTGIEVIAAHLNHGLRGEASAYDARFVEALCTERDVSCIVESADVAAYRAAHRLSPEDAGRRLRYQFLARTVVACSAQGTATGHTADDQAETLLLHVVRGAGLRGLAGMRPVSEREVGPGMRLRLIRPMLGLRRTQTEAFCEALGVVPRLDASNDDISVPRNRIRARVLPELTAINPRAVEALARLANHTSAEVESINARAEQTLRQIARPSAGLQIRLPKRELKGLDSTLLLHVLRAAFARAGAGSAGLASAHIEEMARLVLGRSGTALDLPGNVRLTVERDIVILAREDDADERCPYPPAVPSRPLSPPCTAQLGAGFAITARLALSPRDLSQGAPWVAHLDPDLADAALVVRSRAEGDRFHALGMSRPKRLQDFFVDSYVPSAWRDRIPLVEAERGIIWIAGCRPAEWARLPEGAPDALRLELVRPASPS